jgi:hypothetical protein
MSKLEKQSSLPCGRRARGAGHAPAQRCQGGRRGDRRSRPSCGSWNLKFEYLPADLGTTTVQLRGFRRVDVDEGEPEKGIAADPF